LLKSKSTRTYRQVINSYRQKPDISVVIPVYNRKVRLLTVLESLLRQDFSGSYEILLVDDGSSDGSTDDIEGIDNKIRVIRQINRGAASARHSGVLNARSDIIVYHDSDDIAYPSKLTVMKDALDTHPDCIAAIGISKNPDSNTWKPYWAESDSTNRIVFDEPLEHYFSNYYPLASAMNIALRRDVALFASANIEHFKAANDYQLQFKAASKGKFVCVPIITQEYNVGEGISSTLGSLVQEAFSLISVWENFATTGSPEKFKHHVQRRTENHGPRILLMLIAQKRYPLARQIFVNILKYGRLIKLPRRLFWAFDYYLKTKKTL
jgi:glycosyltransferase involved in cell wall biosynthesis